MRQFIRVSVPTEGYAEVKKMGSRYVVHLEGVADGELTECYETMTNDEPDMTALTEELQQWKAKMDAVALSIAKREKLRALAAYDESPAVNSFEIRRGGEKLTDYWISRDLRTSLEGDVLAASSVGDTYRFDVRELGITLTLPCTWFLEQLARLRIYAYTAFNRTSEHMQAINALTTVDEVQAYDFTTGYPEKLTFAI